MNDEPLFLRPDATVEPLVNQWHAWAYLLSPASAAMYFANGHAKLMKAFAASPQVHATALKNKAMRGGPYVDLEAAAAPLVKELYERSLRDEARSFELAEALRGLDRVLSEEAKGYSLEQLYKKVPGALQGYIELVYDLADNPSVRVMEGLLFETRYHDPTRQSVRLTLASPDGRAYALSTPRVERPGDVALRVPFASRALDALYRARHEAISLAELGAALGTPPAALRPFFTADAPPSPPARPATTRARTFGHASVLLESGAASVFVDPILSAASAAGPARYTHADLPAAIDAVVVTESQPDHCVLEALLELRHRVGAVIVPRASGGNLVDPSLELVLRHAGFPRVVELGELESFDCAGGSVTALPFLGKHADLDIRSKAGFAVRLGDTTTVLLGDSNNVEPRVFERVREWLGDVAALFIGTACDGAPMSWLYGPLFTRPLVRKNDLSRKLDGSDADRALAIALALGAKRVFPYGLGREPWLAHVVATPPAEGAKALVEAERLVAACKERGLEARVPGARDELAL
jgi:L-ascorbate metabolism protein UlaG (beta-lactamase superfamily)